MSNKLASESPSSPGECLAAVGLQSRILFPSDGGYTARIESYWDNSAKLRPACIVQPHSATEVATAVKALADAAQPFAVRSGGHGNWVGTNNITGGVTIDLGRINSIEYDAVAELAHIGPGARWKEVYDELGGHGRMVVGARDGEAGVGGLLLGGGNTWYTPRLGLACDNVVAFEVVLADGRIVTADRSGEHADLFRVLKGGSNNFGIVTRFTLRTVVSGPLWGGLIALPADFIPAATDALVSFTSNSARDLDSTLNFAVGYIPRFGGAVSMALLTNVAGVENPPAFEQFLEMPSLLRNLKVSTVQELLPFAALPNDYFNIWYTLTFKNDASIIEKVVEFHSQLAARAQEKITDGDFATHCSLQPIPKFFAKRSLAAGGNVLGLDEYPHDAIMLQASASVRTQELADWVRPLVRGVVDEVRAFAESIDDGVCPWLHLNYASPDQAVLESYGKDNVRRMREASVKYDANGVFQHLCPGGFKISAVRD